MYEIPDSTTHRLRLYELRKSFFFLPTVILMSRIQKSHCSGKLICVVGDGIWNFSTVLTKNPFRMEGFLFVQTVY